MAQKFTDAAKEKINTDPKLFGELCEMLYIRPSALISNIQRDAERIMRHDVVLAVAAKMGVESSDILEEKEEKQAATA